MITDTFTVKADVQLFPQQGGWHYISVPEEITDITRNYADRGVVAITVTLGETSWDTSLLPKGDGTLFIPLAAKVRKKENITVGDTVEVSFKLRKR